MNKKYLLLTGIIIALGIGMLFMPQRDTDKQLRPEMLLAAIDDPSRFLSTDDITDRLVKQDPALLLIDVRSKEQFNTFEVPGAINIPVDSLLSAPAREIIGQKAKDKVFYSNSDVTSDQAWILCKRLGMERIYVMQGGINTWFSTIVKAVKPVETASVEEINLYQFRSAACQHFFGNSETKTEVATSTKKAVTVTKKPAGASSGGGC